MLCLRKLSLQKIKKSVCENEKSVREKLKSVCEKSYTLATLGQYTVKTMYRDSEKDLLGKTKRKAFAGETKIVMTIL